jgi:hypothetical protein
VQINEACEPGNRRALLLCRRFARRFGLFVHG